MCSACLPHNRKIEANTIPNPYSASKVSRKTPISADQLVGANGT